MRFGAPRDLWCRRRSRLGAMGDLVGPTASARFVRESAAGLPRVASVPGLRCCSDAGKTAPNVAKMDLPQGNKRL